MLSSLFFAVGQLAVAETVEWTPQKRRKEGIITYESVKWLWSHTPLRSERLWVAASHSLTFCLVVFEGSWLDCWHSDKPCVLLEVNKMNISELGVGAFLYQYPTYHNTPNTIESTKLMHFHLSLQDFLSWISREKKHTFDLVLHTSWAGHAPLSPVLEERCIFASQELHLQLTPGSESPKETL